MDDPPVIPADERKGLQEPSAVLYLDRAGVVRGATPEAAVALGRTVDRLLGHPLHEFTPGAKSQVYPWIDALTRLTATPPPRVLDVEADSGGQPRHFDGILYAVQVSAAGAAAAGAPPADAQRPVAGLKLRPSSMMLARTQALDAQQTLLDQMARGATLRDTLREVARFAERQMAEETFCVITTTDEMGATLERGVVAGLPRDMAEPCAGHAVERGSCPAATALREGHPVIATDLDTEPAWHDYATHVRRHGLRAVWSYPVKQGAGTRRAVLDFLHTAPRMPNASQARIAEQMTALVSLALDLDNLRSELETRTANLTTIVASLPVVVWETDAAGILTLIDGGALPLVKLHAADAVGRSPEQAFGASDVTQSLVRHALAGETIWADVPALGRMFAIQVAPIRDAHGVVRGMRGLALDITERKDAERALHESVERLNLVIDASSDGFWDYRLEGGASMVSDRCSEMLGFAPGGMQVATPDRHPLVHAEDRAAVRQAWNDHLAGRTARYESEHRRLAADGTIRWILERGRVVERDEAGRPVRVAGTQTDVTGRRALEQSALTAQKMDALAQVARGFAQDLANVLAAIRGHAALAALSQGLPTRVAESLEVIQLAASRGGALTQNMMALGTPAPIRRTVTGLVAAIHETLRLLKPVMPPQIAVTVHDETNGEDRVLADPVLLQQVLLNLLVRARDAMPSGGELGVTVDRVQRDAQNCELRVHVTDTGVGIAAEDLPHAFDPFYVRAGESVGTGLALALVRSFVDSSGGRIELRSQPGRGTEFIMMLPGAGAPSGDQPQGRRLVVLGESHPLLRPMLAEALQQAGYHVLVPETAESLFAAVAELSEREGAAVVDAAFAHLSPTEIAARVHESAGRRVPVIVAAGPQYAGLELDGLSVVSKPFDLDLLRQRLRACLPDGPSAPDAAAGSAVRKPARQAKP